MTPMRKNGFTKICEQCGAAYYVQAYRASGSKFCSMKCVWAGCPKPRQTARVEKTCQACQKPFTVIRHRATIALFCSKTCSGSDHMTKKHSAARVPASSPLMKVCRSCGIEKPKTQFFKHAHALDGYRTDCKRCRRGVSSLRRERVRQATPPWVDFEAIRALYIQADFMSEVTGVPHHVDHYYPIKGKTMCGLHVAANMRIVPDTVNARKHDMEPIVPAQPLCCAWPMAYPHDIICEEPLWQSSPPPT